MPDAVLIQIADAVTAALTDAGLSIEFIPTRHYLPEIVLADGVTDLRVHVVPGRLASEWISRSDQQTDYGIDVGILQKLGADPTADTATFDALIVLVEEIADLVRGARPDGFPTAICTAIENDPIYSRQHLRDLRQFTAVLRLTYQVIG